MARRRAGTLTALQCDVLVALTEAAEDGPLHGFALAEGLRDGEQARTLIGHGTHEHRAVSARGVPPVGIGLSMLLRLVRGAVADLRWRWQRLASSAASPGCSAPPVTTRRTTVTEQTPDGQRWRPLPELHRFNQLNDVVDVTSDPVGDDAGEQDRAVARNAANIAAGVSAGGLQ